MGLFCYNICMQFTFTLPESLPQMTVKQFLEEQLLILEKSAIFERNKEEHRNESRRSSLERDGQTRGHLPVDF